MNVQGDEDGGEKAWLVEGVDLDGARVCDCCEVDSCCCGVR